MQRAEKILSNVKTMTLMTVCNMSGWFWAHGSFQSWSLFFSVASKMLNLWTLPRLTVVIGFATNVGGYVLAVLGWMDGCA